MVVWLELQAKKLFLTTEADFIAKERLVQNPQGILLKMSALIQELLKTCRLFRLACHANDQGHFTGNVDRYIRLKMTTLEFKERELTHFCPASCE